MPTLKALRQLHGDYGSVAAGESFETTEAIAEQLEAAGLVEPRVLSDSKARKGYETKVIVPKASGVNTEPPFRDVSLSNPEPSKLASESNPMLPGSDVPEQGPTDSGGRRRRTRPGSE